MLIGIDPGETTGVVVYHNGRVCHTKAYTPDTIHEEFAEDMLDILSLAEDDIHIIMEHEIGNSRFMATPAFYRGIFVGIFLMFEKIINKKRDIKFIYANQKPQERLSKIREAKRELKGRTPHEKDALAHVYVYKERLE